VSGVAITGLTPALGQQVFALRVQHREPLDLPEMTVDAGFGRNNWPGDGAGHLGALPLVSKRNYQYPTDCQVNFETLLYPAIMSARETAELLLLVGRLVQADGYEGELSPAQWMALRFFARANSFSRTPSAFAEFQATTRGTASQAIKALEAGGYLVRQRSQADGRSVTLRLTDKGHEVVARDPFEILVRAVGSLDPQEQNAMREALHRVLATLAGSGTHQHFGVCRDCAHLSGEMNAIPECLLFGAPIEPDDATLLCVHFQPRAPRGEFTTAISRKDS
jgi:DNA-binding MarR family transcriptional regulator